jgi:hypothetical protein
MTQFRRRYLSWRISETRRKLKLKAIEYKGGKCQSEGCNYDRCPAVLQFHHMDPSKKDFQISGMSRDWEIMKKELDKTILLCANCHAEIHYVESEQNRLNTEMEIKANISRAQRADHGSPGKYFSGCRCDICRKSHNIRIRDYKRNVRNKSLSAKVINTSKCKVSDG